MPVIAWIGVMLLGGGLFVGGCSTGVTLKRIQEDVSNLVLPDAKTRKGLALWVKAIIVMSAAVVVWAVFWAFKNRKRGVR